MERRWFQIKNIWWTNTNACIFRRYLDFILKLVHFMYDSRSQLGQVAGILNARMSNFLKFGLLIIEWRFFFNFPKVKYLENVKTYSRVQALHHLSISQNLFLNGITESTWLSENVNYYFTSASTAPFDFIKIIF